MDIPMAAIRRARDSLQLAIARMEMSRDHYPGIAMREFYESQISRDKTALDELNAWLEEEAKR